MLIKLLMALLFATFLLFDDTEFVNNSNYSYYKNNIYESYNDSILTVVTYNIQLGFTSEQNPWDKSQLGGTAKQIHAISEIIRQVDPNIIILQEIPRNRYNVEVKKFIETLADSLNMNFAFGSHGKNDPIGIIPVHGMWGNAILTKYPILEIENKKIYNENKWNKRSVLKAKIKLNSKIIIDVFNLHHTGIDKNEVEKTIRFINSSKEYIIVGGDFNRAYGDAKLNSFKEFNDIFNKKLKGIDRIYSNFQDSILEIGTIPRSNYVSDHFAYYAKIKI